MSFSNVTTRNLFPTPFMIAALPPDISAPINKKLAAQILQKAATEKSAQITNIGGWQSDTRILEWGGEEVKTIISALRELIDNITLDLHQPNFKSQVNWQVYGWANVNRHGHMNVAHNHPGAFWSAAYYVQIDDADNTGGEFEILDPRGSLPITYRPQLRIGIDGFQSCGGHELIKPKAGQCVLFPSWLMHAVMPYTGTGTRISLAFNFLA